MTSEKAAAREFDLIVYGATGFVGKLLSDYLARFAPAGTRIALAGRSVAKLEALRNGLPGAAREWPIIVADAADEAAMNSMAARATAIVTTVGPYLKYGIPLVAACAAQGTHYADLTGEVLFARKCIDDYDELARSTGARIVNSCGFDSIPSDLAVLMAYEHARDRGFGTLTDTTLVVRTMKGGFSGGTIDSMRVSVDYVKAHPAAREITADQFALSPDRSNESSRPQPSDTVTLSRNAAFGGWIGPFVMAEHNTRLVRRSNALQNWAYGPEFTYREVVSFGDGLLAPAIALGMGAGIKIAWSGMGIKPMRAVLDRTLPSPGEGPSEEARRAGRFLVEVHAETKSGAKVISQIGATGDPGYQATSVMLAETALSLALDGERLPEAAGVLTPATAMGDVLVERLRNADFTVAVAAVPASADFDHG
ncbi:MAG: saccharopine dehydrogenase NADP-binding domain-containing protein [Candidatus Nanopelagicales bacterium]